MCGFFASNDPGLSEKDLPQIRSRIAFRGPDGQSGLVSCGNWKLYHARLSIIAPREEFSQPLTSKTGATIVFNGEILNFRELVRKYNLPETDSDTDALNALLDTEGFDLNEIDGFFAFVRIDREGRLTHCARDKFGVKPLFVYRSGEVLTVASEASILSDLYDLPYSEAAMEEYRAFRAPVFEGSFFEGAESVEPGSCLVNGVYFDPRQHFGQGYAEQPNIVADLAGLISESVRSRLVSDVPVGLLYSGGIDSNLLSSLTETRLRRFTGGFSGDYDFEFARRQQAAGSPHTTTLIEVSDSAFRERFREMIRLRKEPLSVPNEVILSFLAEAWAKQGGKVLISGEAADEFFAGYDRIFGWAARAPRFDLEQFLGLYCYLPLEELSQPIIGRAGRFFAGLADLSPFEQVRFFFVKKHLPVLFRRLDFALMFGGIEGREPLASSRVFELAMQCGPKDLMADNLGKIPLRALAARELGQDFAFAEKVGFPVDLGRVFRGKAAEGRHGNYRIWCEENLEVL